MTNKNYCEKYDVYYDDKGKYIEKKCTDTSCVYCRERPLRLIDACKGCCFITIDGYLCKGFREK